ncbi:hypothetical protein T492DRAFT_954375, partial [Pavlovales sp. CCMP2436]
MPHSCVVCPLFYCMFWFTFRLWQVEIRPPRLVASPIVRAFLHSMPDLSAAFCVALMRWVIVACLV